MNSELVAAYTDKILGIRNYKSDKKEFFAEDFVSIETLERFLDELDTSESDITPAGKMFLEQYYGFDNLSKLLVERKQLTESIRHYSAEQLSEWLHTVQPMETITFIEESRGNISPGQSLKENVLPPLVTVHVVKNECPVCGSGPVGLVLISDINKVVPVCYECESVWEQVNDIESKEPLDLRHTPKIFPEIDITKVDWATEEEIRSFNMSGQIVDTKGLPMHNLLD